DVDDDQPTRLEPVADELEELPRGEVEGDVRLAIRGDHDHVEPTRLRKQPRPRVRGVGVEVRPLQVEEGTADLRQLAVELHGVDPGLWEVVTELPCRRAGRITEDRDRPRG